MKKKVEEKKEKRFGLREDELRVIFFFFAPTFPEMKAKGGCLGVNVTQSK